MHTSILWPILGFGSLIAAAIIVTKVESAELGTYSGRLVAVILAFLAYYGVTSLAGDFPILVMNPVRYRFMAYLMPVIAAVSATYLVWKIHKNWKTEMDSAVKSGWKIVLIVGFSICARFFLSL
jgi:hypothetical protein